MTSELVQLEQLGLPGPSATLVQLLVAKCEQLHPASPAFVMLLGVMLEQQQQGQPGLPGPSPLLIKLVATQFVQHQREHPGLRGPS